MIGYFIFDDIDTRNYEGIAVTEVDVDSAPERVYEEVVVAGRSGTILMDMKRYDNVVHSYDVVVYDDYVDNLVALRNDLLSKVGYHTLTDSFNTDEKYLATVYASITPSQKTQRNGGYLHIEFSRKPQRFLLSGETAVTPSDYGNPQTETGEIVTIDSDGSLGVKSLDVSLSPIQDLHGYDKPWAGGAGKNLMSPQNITGSMSNVAVSSDGDVVTFNGTASAYGQVIADSTFVLEAGTYYLKLFVVSGSGNVVYQLRNMKGTTTYVSTQDGVGFTLLEQAEVKARVTYRNGAIFDNFKIKAMIVKGNVAPSAYEPYENICPISGRTEVKTIVSPTTSATDGRTYTTALGRTVYGGMLDVVSGELTVTHGFKTLDGSENWALGTRPQSYNGANFYIAKETGVATGVNGYKCNILDKYASTYVQDGLFISSGYWNFIIGNAIGVGNVSDFKTWLSRNNIQLMYPLATPQTIQLTPQQIDLLLGTNHLWSDGEITVEYGTHPFYNPTQFESKPLIVVTGKGVLQIGDYVLTIGGTETQTLYIDCDSQEAWEVVGAGKISRNDYIRNAGEEFPVLMPGVNNISVGSGISSVTITPRWWRL